MNKTLLFVVFAIVVVIGFAGYVVLLAMDPTPDPARADRVVTSLVLLLGILTTAAGQFYQLGKIEKQTNGTLSKERAHNAALTQQVAEAGLVPVAPPGDPDLGVLPD